MNRSILVALVLLWSAGASSQPATFSTQTGSLEIPALVVDGRSAFDDVELSLNDAKTGGFTLVDFSRKAAEFNGLQELTLAYGETVQFNDTTTLTFTDVLAESRCPTGFFCITSGEVTVLLDMTETLKGGNTKKTLFGVTLQGLSISEPEINGIYFRLADALPYPVSTETVVDEDYVIRIEYSAVPFK